MKVHKLVLKNFPDNMVRSDYAHSDTLTQYRQHMHPIVVVMLSENGGFRSVLNQAVQDNITTRAPLVLHDLLSQSKKTIFCLQICFSKNHARNGIILYVQRTKDIAALSSYGRFHSAACNLPYFLSNSGRK